MQLLFDYALVGSIDGRILTQDDVLLASRQIFSSIGSKSLFRATSNQVGSSMGPENEQFIFVSALVGVKAFTNRVVYDPDIGLQLLFDPGAPAPTAGGPTNAGFVGDTNSNTIAIAVGVSVAAVAVVAGLVRPSWFPCLRGALILLCHSCH